MTESGKSTVAFEGKGEECEEALSQQLVREDAFHSGSKSSTIFLGASWDQITVWSDVNDDVAHTLLRSHYGSFHTHGRVVVCIVHDWFSAHHHEDFLLQGSIVRDARE